MKQSETNLLTGFIAEFINVCIQDGMHRKATVWYTAYKPGLAKVR